MFPERPGFAAPWAPGGARLPAAGRAEGRRGGSGKRGPALGGGPRNARAERAAAGQVGGRERRGKRSPPPPAANKAGGGGLSARGCLQRACGAGRPGRAPGRGQVGWGLLALPAAAPAPAALRPQGRAAGAGAGRAPGPVRAPRSFSLSFPGLVGPAGLLCLRFAPRISRLERGLHLDCFNPHEQG